MRRKVAINAYFLYSYKIIFHYTVLLIIALQGVCFITCFQVGAFWGFLGLRGVSVNAILQNDSITIPLPGFNVLCETDSTFLILAVGFLYITPTLFEYPGE